MKLSEMSTRKAAECMAIMIDAVGRITKDAKVKTVIEEAALAQRAYEQKLRIMTGLPPVLLREHLEDTAQIVATLMNKTTKEVLEQPISQTVQDIRNSLDGELLDFFAPSGTQEQAASST